MVRKNHPAPDIPFHFQHYLKAYSFLFKDRINTANGQGGVSLGYIPLTALVAYADLFRVQDPRPFVRILTAVDEAYVAKARLIDSRRKDKK